MHVSYTIVRSSPMAAADPGADWVERCSVADCTAPAQASSDRCTQRMRRDARSSASTADPEKMFAAVAVVPGAGSGKRLQAHLNFAMIVRGPCHNSFSIIDVEADTCTIGTCNGERHGGRLRCFNRQLHRSYTVIGL